MPVKNYPGRLAVFLLLVLISACSSLEQQAQTLEAASSMQAFANDIADKAIMAKWARSCALCHVTGGAGAPLVGDSEQWRSRLAQGEEIILQHTIEGYNSMPPLGYCMACEVSDFRAMIGYMAGTNR